MHKKIAVIGAGPAGMCAAIVAAQNGAHVDLYDHNEKTGKKLFITGKGRCNLTNAAPIEDFFDHIPTNKNFLYSALYTFTNDMLIDMIEAAGCPTKTERGGRVFPVSDKSSDVIKAFNRLLAQYGVKTILGRHVSGLSLEKQDGEDVCAGIVVGKQTLPYDAVILASGGMSYPATGSDGSGYQLAKQAGHKIEPPEASLVGMTTQENWTTDLSGLTLKNIGLTLLKKGRVIFKEQGECLMTHTGISGPVVLSASAYVRPPYQDYEVRIDLKPALTPEKLDQRVQRDFLKYANKDFSNALSDLLPKKLIPVIISASGIPEHQKVNGITREQRRKLVDVLKNLPLTVAGLPGLKGAIVTRGGINVREIDPGSMASRLVKHLYFAGEVIDVDALTGGYNIQIAASTGYLAGSSAAQE